MRTSFLKLGLIFCVFLSVGCTPDRATITAEPDGDVSDGEIEGAVETVTEEDPEMTYRCRAPGHEHEEGQLLAEYEEGKLVKWRCILSSHHICTAPPDGKWTECTFPPDENWPQPVDSEFLATPPPPPDKEEKNPERSEDY